VKWRLSRRAAQDFDDIYLYRSQDSEETAQRVLSAIIAAIRRTALQPLSGRPGGRPGIREIVLTDYPYVIPYRLQDGDLIVLRIFHMSRDRP
jgi:toxin ParE1/3/4